MSGTAVVQSPHSGETHLLRFAGSRTVCELDARGWSRASGEPVAGASAELRAHKWPGLPVVASVRTLNQRR